MTVENRIPPLHFGFDCCRKVVAEKNNKMHRAQDTEINDQDKELERFTDEIDTEEGNPPPLSNDLLSESDMTLSLLGVDDIADMD